MCVANISAVFTAIVLRLRLRLRLWRWLGVGLLAGVLPLLVACGATSVPAGPTSLKAAASPTPLGPGPDPAGASQSASCGRVVVGGASGLPMPAVAARCLSLALHDCRAAGLVVLEQGVDVVRTDTLNVTPGGTTCVVSVTEDLKVVPRPVRTTTFTCRLATVTQGALALTKCSDARSHTFPINA